MAFKINIKNYSAMYPSHYEALSLRKSYDRHHCTPVQRD